MRNLGPILMVGACLAAALIAMTVVFVVVLEALATF